MAEQELALVGGAINASTISEALTPQLEEALLKAEDATTAAKTIAASPKLLAEARDKLSLISRLAGPTEAEDLYVCMEPLLIMFGAPDFGQDQGASKLQKAWFALYVQALKDMPRESIEIAIQLWLQKGKPFFPKPTELYALAEKEALEIRLIAHRLKRAVERAAEHKPVPRKADDVKRARELIAGLKDRDGRIRLGKSIPRSPVE